MSRGCQIVTPSGLFILLAIFANKRLAAKPIEQVMYGPILFRIRFFIFFANSCGLLRSVCSSLHVISSMDLTASIGITAEISFKNALCARQDIFV